NSNCARMALPKVSAVMPVPSETKKTVRVCMGRVPESAAGEGWRRLQFRPLSEFRDHGPPPIRTTRKPAGGTGHLARSRRPLFNCRSFSVSARFSATALVVPFETLRMTDVEVVGGKNASLGEMISQLPHGVRVPTGF